MAVTILDYLYFYDIVSLQTLTNDKIEFFVLLLSKIDEICKSRFLKDERAELYKHYIICYFEIKKSPSKHFKLKEEAKEKRNLFIKELVKRIDDAKFDREEFGRDIDELESQLDLKNREVKFFYNLTSQMLYFEYDSIAIGVLVYFIELGILDSKKYQRDKNEMGVDFIVNLFKRAMLFIEFQNFKKNIFYVINQDVKMFDINQKNIDYKRLGLFINYRYMLEKESKSELEKSSIIYSAFFCENTIYEYLELLKESLLISNENRIQKDFLEFFLNWVKSISNVERKRMYTSIGADENFSGEINENLLQKIIQYYLENFETYKINTYNELYKKSVISYIKKISYFLNHVNIFTQNKSTMISLIAAWHMLSEDIIKPNNILYRNTFVNVEGNSLTHDSKKIFLKYGFTIQEQTFYKYHKILITLYQLIKDQAEKMIVDEDFGIFVEEPIIYFFSDPTISKDFQNQLNKEINKFMNE